MLAFLGSSHFPLPHSFDTKQNFEKVMRSDLTVGSRAAHHACFDNHFVSLQFSKHLESREHVVWKLLRNVRF